MSSGLSPLIWEDEPGAFHPHLMTVCKILSFTWTVCTSGQGALVWPLSAWAAMVILQRLWAPSLQSCLTEIPWTIARQASLSMGFSRQEYWSGLPCPSPGDHLNPGIKTTSPVSPALQVLSLPTEPPKTPTSHAPQADLLRAQ